MTMVTKGVLGNSGTLAGEQIRPKYTEERYDEWFRRQSEEMQKELLEHEKLHPKETIYDAFYDNDE